MSSQQIVLDALYLVYPTTYDFNSGAYRGRSGCLISRKERVREPTPASRPSTERGQSTHLGKGLEKTGRDV